MVDLEREGRLQSVGADSESLLQGLIREKVLEFEVEREAYVETARQLQRASGEQYYRRPQETVKTPLKARRQNLQEQHAGAAYSTKGRRRELAGTTHPEDLGVEEDKENSSVNVTGDGAIAASGRGGDSDPRRLLKPERRSISMTAAREGRQASAEQIRFLQQRKADAAVRLQGERLSNLEQGLELGGLRLERLLDRERILELLRLTDPQSSPSAKRGGNEGKGSEDGGEVSEEVIRQLEDRVEQAEARLRTEATNLGTTVAARLADRAMREEVARKEEAISSEGVARLQATLRDKEDRLARTVVDYLELRHAMLRAQRVSTAARDDAAAARVRQEEQIRECVRDVEHQRRETKETVDRTSDAVRSELEQQIQLRIDEACMLREQHAETKELYEGRAARLEGLLEDLKAKYIALRRRFALETEGFRRDADEIGRRFERIRAGPPGGRPAISSRSGSSARQAVERAIYRPPTFRPATLSAYGSARREPRPRSAL